MTKYHEASANKSNKSEPLNDPSARICPRFEVLREFLLSDDLPLGLKWPFKHVGVFLHEVVTDPWQEECRDFRLH